MKDSDVEVRKAAVSTLEKTGDRAVIENLQVAMNDEAEVVRTLGKVGDRSSRKTLRSCVRIKHQ
jgi:bilin biosynthesis protein